MNPEELAEKVAQMRLRMAFYYLDIENLLWQQRRLTGRVLPLVMVHDPRGQYETTWHAILINRSTVPDPKYPVRVSYFNPTGFYHHHHVTSVFEALREEWHYNYRLVPPSFLDKTLTPEFLEGCLESNGFKWRNHATTPAGS